jgi:hypothetical protein
VAARPGADRPGREPLTGIDETTLGSLTVGHRPVRLRRADADALVALLADDPLGHTREDGGDPDLVPYRRALARIDADPAHCYERFGFVASHEGFKLGWTIPPRLPP